VEDDPADMRLDRKMVTYSLSGLKKVHTYLKEDPVAPRV